MPMLYDPCFGSSGEVIRLQLSPRLKGFQHLRHLTGPFGWGPVRNWTFAPRLPACTGFVVFDFVSLVTVCSFFFFHRQATFAGSQLSYVSPPSAPGKIKIASRAYRLAMQRNCL
jgi:hypothetical protein